MVVARNRLNSVRCWGANASGQLGLGHTRTLGDDEPIASVGTVDLGGARALRITAGDRHTCALLTSGHVRCWGDNTHGQLGLGHTDTLGDMSLGLGGSVLTATVAVMVLRRRAAET